MKVKYKMDGTYKQRLLNMAVGAMSGVGGSYMDDLVLYSAPSSTNMTMECK